MNAAKNTAWPVLLGTLGFIIWGSSPAMVKIALRQFDPVFLVFARMALTLLLLSPLVYIKFGPPRLPGTKDFLLLGLLVLFEPVILFTFEALALKYTSAAQLGMIWATVPLFYSLGGWLIFKETVSLKQGLCFLVAVAGVILLTAAGKPSGQASNPLLGNALVLVSMGGGVGFVLLLRYFRDRYPPLLIVWIQSLGATFFLLPPVLGGAAPAPAAWAAGPTLAFVYLVLGVTIAAQMLCVFAIGRIPVPAFAAISNVLPVSCVLFGLFLLGENLLPLQWAACAIVLVAVIANQRVAEAGM